MRLCFLFFIVHQGVFIHETTGKNIENEDSTLELLLAKFENLEEKLKAYEEKSRQQEDEIRILKKQILQNKEESTFRSRRESEYPVAFYGNMLTQHQHLSSNNIIMFNNVITNIGTPYSINNGLFIAPLPGIYVFSTTVMIEDRNDAHVGIFINDVLTTKLKLYGSEYQFDTMSQTAVYKLEKNDTVSVRRYEGTTIVHFDYTSFSGFLLQEYQSPGSASIIG